MRKKIIKIVLFLIALYFLIAITGIFFASMSLDSIKNTKADTREDADKFFKNIQAVRAYTYPIRPFLLIQNKFRKELIILDKLIQNKDEVIKLLGYDKETTVMMVLQDNAELRPSGGLWGAYGIIKIKNGSINSFNTYDTYYVDQENKGKFSSPSEISSIIEDEWRFWNANWSPDFKASVEQGLFFYSKAKPDEKIDAVIGPNLDYMLSILDISGPVSLDQYSFALNSKNFIDKMIYETSSPAVYESQKKSGNVIDPDEKNNIIAGIGTRIINQIKQNGKILKFLDTTLGAIEKQNLQMYFASDKLEKIAGDFGWAGKVPTDGNLAMVVDANMGSKLDLFINKEITITQLDDQKYKIEIKYSNNESLSSVKQNFVVYRDYVRVFLPKGIKLLNQGGGEVSQEVKSDSSTGLDYLSTVLIINPGQTKSVSFTWQVPPSLAGVHLKVIKQSGQNAEIIKNLQG